MSTPTDFNVGANVKATRKLLMTYVDVSSTSTPEWELIGAGVEDSSIALNPNTETVTDILGITETSVTKWEPTQSFEPYTVKGGSKLAFKLHETWRTKHPENLSNFTVLVVYAYIGDTTDGYYAETQTGCTINITSIGGSAYVDMPIEVTYSNKTTVGTVKFTDGEPTFTAAA